MVQMQATVTVSRWVATACRVLMFLITVYHSATRLRVLILTLVLILRLRTAHPLIISHTMLLFTQRQQKIQTMKQQELFLTEQDLIQIQLQEQQDLMLRKTLNLREHRILRRFTRQQTISGIQHLRHLLIQKVQQYQQTGSSHWITQQFLTELSQ